MKYLLLLAFVVSCASNQKPVYQPVAGDPITKITENNGAPQNCVDIADHKYCKWSSSSKIQVFKDSKFSETLPEPKNNFAYNVMRESLSAGEKVENKYKAVPGDKNMTVKSLEWKMKFPKIEKILKASGIQFADGEQKMEISFHRKDVEGVKNYHSLIFKGLKKDEEVWSLNVGTNAGHIEFEETLPLLLLASYDLIINPVTKTEQVTFTDRSLELIAFRHFLGLK